MTYAFTVGNRTIQYDSRSIADVMKQVAWEFKGQLTRGTWVQRPSNAILAFFWKED